MSGHGQRGEPAKARSEGIILAKNLVEPHKPRDNARRIIELPVREAMFARLVELARKQGRTPAQYAYELFEAAYSARCAPTGDAALDDAVASIGQNRPDEELARELDIVSAWLSDQKTENRQLRAKLAEARDERNSWRDDATANDDALQAIGEEFGIHAGEHRIDGVRRILGEMRDELAALKSEDAIRARHPLVTATPARPIPPPTTRLHINAAPDRSAELQGALVAAAKAAREGMIAALPIEIEPDAATIRAVRGLRAAGNSAVEVARTLKLPLETVRRILGGGK